MTKDHYGEQWKKVVLDFDSVKNYRLEVSNFGRVRAFHRYADGNILKGGMVNGYKIYRFRFFKNREPKVEKQITAFKKQISKLATEIRLLKKEPKKKKQVVMLTKELNERKAALSKLHESDLKSRVIYYQVLAQRLVAEYFCNRPSAKYTVVAHLDYDKLNNRKNNLKWMTPEENYAHQQKSPYVIAERRDRKNQRKENNSTTKLTVTKVMLLKKLLNQNKPIRTLVKQFKVTDTQILRIKRGENWGEVKAAK